jgi:hypothetical protein
VNSRLFLASVVFVAAACTTYGADTPGGDAGTGGNGDASPGNDAASEDGFSPSDGSTEAGPQPCPDGGFCDSFERTAVLGAWDSFAGNGPCPVVIDPMVGSVGSSSLHATLAAVDAGLCEGSLLRSFPSASRKITLAFDLRLSASSDRRINFMNVRLGSTYMHFALQSGALSLTEQADVASSDGGPGFYASHGLGDLTSGVFHHIALDYTFATSSFGIVVDGEKRLDGASGQRYDGAGANSANAGVTFSAPGSRIDLWFDDYRFTSE